ncbi:hypothetical protein [Bradyrhizobium sp. 151]|uniref:hypothetical protein n=1 Tax=Bradyrhizobium sp. 151 TaxID=2782626 RepID=UPI00320B1049
MAHELNQAFASAETRTICRAIGRALKDFNISEISKKTGLPRTSIYRAFGNEQLPNFATVLGVLTAMGLELKVPPCAAPLNNPNRRSHRRTSNADNRFRDGAQHGSHAPAVRKPPKVTAPPTSTRCIRAGTTPKCSSTHSTSSRSGARICTSCR